MKFQIKSVVASALVALVCSPAFAKTQDLGVLSDYGSYFGNSFNTKQTSFTDIYTFTIAADGDVSGTTSDYKATVFFRDVNLTSLELFSQPAGISIYKEASVADEFTFNFAGLSAGAYSLKVTGSVSGSAFGAFDSAEYEGFISTTASVASPAPEPADLAMAMMGLAGVGLLLRRRNKAVAA